MTTRFALFLLALVLIAIAVDQTLYAGEYGLFLARRFFDLIQSLAFWR